MLQKHSNKLDSLWDHSMALSAWQPHCHPNSHMQSSKGAQSLSSYTRLHSRLATHTTQSIIRHSFLSNQQWLGSWIKYHFSNKSQVGKLIPSCQATHDLDSTSADTSCSACFTSASTYAQSDGFQFNLSCTTSYVIQELITKQLLVVQTMDEATCLPIPDIWHSLLPWHLSMFQHCLCRASIFEVISPDNWPTAYSGLALKQRNSTSWLRNEHIAF